MQFLLFTLLLTSVSATPILRRDSTPSIAVIDQELNRVVLVPATSSSSSKRDLALPVVVDASSNRIVEHAGAAATRLRARDLSPAIPVVDQDLNRVVLVSGSNNAKRDLVVPVVDATASTGRVVEHAAAVTANDKRALTGIVPAVVDGKVVAVDMTAENIVA